MLKGALIVNPHDMDQIASAIHKLVLFVKNSKNKRNSTLKEEKKICNLIVPQPCHHMQNN